MSQTKRFEELHSGSQPTVQISSQKGLAWVEREGIEIPIRFRNITMYIGIYKDAGVYIYVYKVTLMS